MLQRLLLPFTLFFCLQTVQAQDSDSSYYKDIYSMKPTSAKKAKYLRVASQSGYNCLYKHVDLTSMVALEHYVFEYDSVTNGHYLAYDLKGNVLIKKTYEDVVYCQPVSTDLKGNASSPIGGGVPSKDIVEPEFVGGQSAMYEWIGRNLKFPNEARNLHLTGTVYIEFYVNAEGVVESVCVERSVHPILDQAAIDLVLKMPNWTPGNKNGEPISTFYQLPLKFSLR